MITRTDLQTIIDNEQAPSIEPTWLSSHVFLARFWPNQPLDPETLVRFRRPGQHNGWLEAIQGRMTADGAIDDSTTEIMRCLSPCVSGELLVNLAMYLRDAGYDILNEDGVGPCSGRLTLSRSIE